MDTRHDVIIVGCGPAGATAGYILARMGMDVVLIDRHTFPREKLCGGMLSGKTMKLMERVFGESLESMAACGIINYLSHEYGIHYRQDPLVRDISATPFVFVDRQRYDAFLLDKVRSLHVPVIEGDRVIAVDPLSNGISTSSGRRMHGRIIIGADGAHSVVRKQFPAGRDTRSHNTAMALEVFMPLSRLARPLHMPIISLGYVDWGYAWIFPNSDRVILGLGGLPRKNKRKINDMFKDFLSETLQFTDERDMDGIRIHGHPIPYGNYMRKPVYRGMILVGDAAGMADPITGEGIFHAHRSAEIAAHGILLSLQTGESLERTCVKPMRRHLVRELLWARLLRNMVFPSLAMLPEKCIHYLVRKAHRRALMVINGSATYALMATKQGIHGDIHA